MHIQRVRRVLCQNYYINNNSDTKATKRGADSNDEFIRFPFLRGLVNLSRDEMLSEGARVCVCDVVINVARGERRERNSKA